MPPIIKVENISKQYRVGTREAGYSTLRETLVSTARAPLRMFRNGWREDQKFWALRDVSFEVNPGEVVGIIGRNGAGKSTLLKVLSRITEPTTGKIELYGRIGSLLEVGTGFHPELTGRENIYLNGSILGMARHEVESKFDEIVSFAEIGKFLDTPVKRYSSGMYLRLAFAVAAHLEPEILVVDEVLAVGDYAFQQKCLNKMQDVSTQGRTVLFVSHNLGAISRLCQRCILLERGRILEYGPTAAVVQTYTSSSLVQRAELVQASAPDRPMNLLRIALVGTDGSVRSEVGYNESFRFVLEYEIGRALSGVSLGMMIFTSAGTCAFTSADFDEHPELLAMRSPGTYRTEVEIPARWLNVGRYTVTVALANAMSGEGYDNREAIVFNVIDTGTPGSVNGIDRPGILQPVLDWKTTLKP